MSTSARGRVGDTSRGGCQTVTVESAARPICLTDAGRFDYAIHTRKRDGTRQPNTSSPRGADRPIVAGRALTVHRGPRRDPPAFPVEESLEDDLVRLLLRLRTPTCRARRARLDHRAASTWTRAAAHAVLKVLIDNEILLRTDSRGRWKSAYGWKGTVARPGLYSVWHVRSAVRPELAERARWRSAGPSSGDRTRGSTGSRQLRFSGARCGSVHAGHARQEQPPTVDHGITLEDAVHRRVPVCAVGGRTARHVVFIRSPSVGPDIPSRYLSSKTPDAPSGVYHLASATGALAMVADARLAQQSTPP
jgi:hypothetical protein